MKWLVLVMLIACGKKASEPPKLAEIDRSCAQDLDCTLTGNPDCCTLCGSPVGESVNAKAWFKANAGRDDRCKDVKCPQAMCEKGPTCHYDAKPVCRANRCDIDYVANAACAELKRSPDVACTNSNDCVMYSFRDCCDHCGGTPMNKQVAERKRALEEKSCTSHNCPPIDCPAQMPSCVDNQCVVP